MSGTVEDVGSKLVAMADELRAIGVNGLHWSANEYDQARYDRVLSLAAELLSIADTRPAEEIERAYRGNLAVCSPIVGVEAAIFDEMGRILLVQRTDTNRWCMPGGLADVGELPSQVAEREAWEETGLHVVARRLLGVFDSHVTLGWPLMAVHIYHLTFICEETGGTLRLTNETLAYGYFTEEAAAALPLHRGHAYRVPLTFKAHKGEVEGCLFH